MSQAQAANPGSAHLSRDPARRGAGPRCPICAAAPGQSRHQRRFAARGAEVLDLYRCRACACEFLSPQPADAWLASAYAGYFAKRRGSIADPKVGFFQDLLRENCGDLNGRRLVEIGAAEGECVLAAQALWPDCLITAVDGHPESAAYACRLPCQYFSETVETWVARPSRERYDACLMLDVLEHLRDPVSVLRTLVSERLAPGALVLAISPNVDALSRRLLGPFWPHYNIEHLHYLSRRGVEVLAGRCGLTTRRLTPWRKPLPLGYALDVLSHFGPAASRRVGRLARWLIPRAWDRRVLPLGLGGWLWVAQRASESADEGPRLRPPRT